MKKHRFSIRALLALTVATALGGAVLAACTANTESIHLGLRGQTADRLAGPVHMLPRHIAVAPFDLTVYERVRAAGGTATVYIEGDGFPWMSRQVPALDPTPRNPVALHLATRDDGPNVIYMARPCQYSKLLDRDKACTDNFWTYARYSPQVIQVMNTALDDIRQRYGFTGFHLVGYSGGGAVAALMAQSRGDVRSLRTVAGNMDVAVFSALHSEPYPRQSLNPATGAQRLAHIPQHHFIGRQDEIMPTPVFDSYARAMGPSACLRSSFVDGADHETGWVNKWPVLLQAPLDCTRNYY